MEFPGLLGVGLYRLKTWLTQVPLAALGPLFAAMAADMSIDIARGRYGSVLFEIVLAPLIAFSVMKVAQRSHPGRTGIMMFILGSISALGASSLIARGFSVGSGLIVIMGIRHLTVAIYAWAAIATEPPVRREARFAPVGA